MGEIKLTYVQIKYKLYVQIKKGVKKLKPLNVRFPDIVPKEIEFISNSGDLYIAKSLVARAAMNIGLAKVKHKMLDMSHEELILWLDEEQRNSEVFNEVG